MVVSLSKNDRIDLDKVAEDAGSSLNVVTVGLGWKAKAGLFGGTYDLDASALVLDESGQVLSRDWFVWYNHKYSPNGVVSHSGDNLVGSSGKKDDEQIVIDLPSLPKHAQRVVIVVDIYEAASKGQSFKKVKGAYMRIIDHRGTELTRYNLTDEFGDETAVTFGELIRSGNGWDFRAIGHGEVTDLHQLALRYGA